MGSFARMTGGIGAAVLAGAALTMAQAPAQAAAKKKVIVPCSAPALAAAITAANATPATLNLAANCTYDITTAATATDALPIITGNVRLVGGPSTTIRRNAAAGAVRILEVATTGTLRVDGIFILNGAPAAAAAGGGIQNAGSLTLNQVTLGGNTTTTAAGGGVNNTASGHATILRTLIGENTAIGGSGGGVNNAGILRIQESRLSANNATDAAGGGGGLANQAGARSTIVQTTFDHNTTTGSGAGIRNLGNLLIDHTLKELNAATISGGGIFNLAPGTVTIFTSTIHNNTPNNCFPLNTIPGCVN